MRWQRFVGCLLAAVLLAALPDLAQARGFGGGGGGGGGMRPGSGRGGPPAAFRGGRAWGGRAWGGRAWGGRFVGHGFIGHRFFRNGNRIVFVGGPGFFWGGPWWGYPWWWDYPPYYGYGYGGYGYGDYGYGDYGYGGPDPSYSSAYYGMSGVPTYSYRTSPGGENTAVQIALRRQGYYRGPIDGDIGPSSQRAIRSFQRDNDLPVTGTVDSSLLHALRVRT
jgi:hypothetical protein